MFFKIIGGRIDSHGRSGDPKEMHQHSPLPLHHKEALPAIVQAVPFECVTVGSPKQGAMETKCKIEHIEVAHAASESCSPPSA